MLKMDSSACMPVIFVQWVFRIERREKNTGNIAPSATVGADRISDYISNPVLY